MINKIMTLNKTSLRLTCDELTARASRDFSDLKGTECGVANGSCLTTFLRPFSSKRAELERRLVVFVLLMLFFGFNVSWAADYDGIWYINNQRLPDDGYYFVPTINCFYNGDEDQPHLTTFKTGKDKNSIWRIVSVTVGTDTYYRIIHNATGKYLMANTAISALGTSNAHRKRVHLETLSAEALATLDLNPSTDKSLFFLNILDADNKIIAIKSKNVGSSISGEGNAHLYLNPRGNGSGEFDSYRAADGRAITNTNGIVGFYGNDSSYKPSDQAGSQWKLETATSTCANPVIKYIDSDTKIQISYPIGSDTDWTIYYTTDGSDPSDATNSNRTEITATATLTDLTGVSKVRAIATKSGWDSSEESVLIASGKTQLVQSKDCEAFYMVPPIADGETYATTTNIPNAAMGWYFVPAGLYCGIQYYNIINAETGQYLYCNVNNGQDNAIIMKSSSDIISDTYNQTIDRAKFRLIVQADGSYKVISKWWAAENPNAYYVNKKNGNNGANALNLADGSNNYGLWNVIAAPTNPKTQFDASFASSSSSIHFYQIQSATDNTYHVLPPASSGGNATANTTDVNPAWFFMSVDDNDTWIPYYHIRNGATGEYLYFNGAAGSNNTFFTSSSIDSGNEDKYMFIIAKSANPTYPDHYNIIPKALKDQANQENNSLNRNNTTLRTQNSRYTDASNWKFEEVALSCNNPVFNEDNGSISISCVPDITTIYYTTDGTEPNPNDETQRYTNISLSASDKLCIKAISTVSNESTSASSAVITLLNKPDVTLAGGPYTYKAAAWEPSVTLSVSTTQTTTGFLTTYGNHTDAGTANVTITDADDTDNLYIWNVPVTEFTIDKAPLTIKANDKTIGYGDDPDNAGVTYTGFVGNPAETETVLGGTLSYSYTTSGDDPHPYTPYDAQYGNQGTYVITPSGLTSTNYNITFISGTLTVTGKSIGDGSLASGFTLSFDESGEVILKYGTHTLTEGEDYTIGEVVVGTKYTTRSISGVGNYTGSLDIRNAIVQFTTDANQTQWSATFVAESSGVNDIGHALPDGISAYIISAIEGAWAIPEPLEYIPADVPVLLVTHEAKNGFLVKDASNVTAITPEQIAYNKLKRVTAESAHFNTKEIYVLYKNEFVLNKGGDLGNGKVYMENPNYDAPSPSPAPANLRIAWGNSTGIETVHSEGLTVNDQSDRWYTLDGRRLSDKPTTKGLYIVNGKKIVIK